MGISESQLDTWSNPGATTSSAATYTSIKAALDAHTWPDGMKYEPYLQGSYANFTNIRGNSDVDIVVELTSVAYSDLTEAQKAARGVTIGKHSYKDIRREVIAALVGYYGARDVDASGANAIMIAAGPSRLRADVLPCVMYNRYNGANTPIAGITFWNQHTNEQKLNFPKVHIANGSAKNNANSTNGWYKPSVRMFKNARERIIGNSDELRKRYPSYFVECLLSNVPNSTFGTSYAKTYVGVVNFLSPALNDSRAARFTTQSQQQTLFGTASTQWSLTNAQQFVAALITLWNKS